MPVVHSSAEPVADAKLSEFEVEFGLTAPVCSLSALLLGNARSIGRDLEVRRRCLDSWTAKGGIAVAHGKPWAHWDA